MTVTEKSPVTFSIQNFPGILQPTVHSVTDELCEPESVCHWIVSLWQMASFVEEGVAAFGGAAAPGGPFVDLAGSLSSAAASQLSSNASMLRALLNMGVRFSATQEGTLSAIRADASVQAVMERLAAHLASHMFLAGERLSETDVAVALRLYDLLSLVYPQSACPSQYAAVARWFATVVQDARVRAFLASKGKLTGGTVSHNTCSIFFAAVLRAGFTAAAAESRNVYVVPASKLPDARSILPRLIRASFHPCLRPRLVVAEPSYRRCALAGR